MATAGRTTTEAGAEASTPVATTRTEEGAATATSPTGREGVEEEAGTTATMTRTNAVPGGGAPDPARPGSALSAGAAPATPTAHLRGGPGAPGTPATPHGPVPPPRGVVAVKSGRPPRTPKTSRWRAKRRRRAQTAASLKKHPEANGLTTTPAPNGPARTRRTAPPLVLTAKHLEAVVELSGKPSAQHPHRPRVLPSLDRQLHSAALGSSQKRTPQLETKPVSLPPSKSTSTSLFPLNVAVLVSF